MRTVEHIVLFKVPDLSAEEEERFLREVNSFAGFDGVISVRVGRVTRGNMELYTHVMVMEVADWDALHRYIKQERHQQFVQWILPHGEVAIFGFEDVARAVPQSEPVS